MQLSCKEQECKVHAVSTVVYVIGGRVSLIPRPLGKRPGNEARGRVGQDHVVVLCNVVFYCFSHGIRS